MSFVTRQLAMIQLAFKETWAYKFDFFMFAISGPLRILVYYLLWQAIYSNLGAETIRGFTFNQMATYYLLALMLGIITFNQVDKVLANKVKFGELTKDLVKPYNFFSVKLSQIFGDRLIALIIEIPLLVLMGIFFLNMRPASWVHASLFVASVALAFVLSHTIVFLFGTSAFWVKEYRGVYLLRQGIVALCSGYVIPLAFFPQAIQTVFNYLPFKYLLYVPITIFNGQLSIQQSLVALAVQAAWVVGLILLNMIIWRRALRIFTGVGS